MPKTYSIYEIILIREAARAHGVESFALDLLSEGLTVAQARERLRLLAEKVDGKKTELVGK
jgi:hypothetical protein